MSLIVDAPALSPGNITASVVEQYLSDFRAVVLGTGDYTLDETIQLNGQPVAIVGKDPLNTRIIWDGTGPAIDITPTDTSGYTFAPSISGFTVAPSGGPIVAGSAGIKIGRSTGSPKSGGCHLRNVEFEYLDKALDMHTSIGSTFTDMHVRFCNYAIHNDSITSSIVNTFTNCRFEQQNEVVILWDKGQHLVFKDCIFQLNRKGWGLFDEATSGANVRNIWFERCYFENNWQSLGGGGGGEADLELLATDAVGVREFHMVGCTWQKDANTDFHYKLAPNCEVVVHDGDTIGAAAVDVPTSGTRAQLYSPRNRLIQGLLSSGMPDAASAGLTYDVFAVEGNDTAPTGLGDTIDMTGYTSATNVTKISAADYSEGMRIRALINSNVTLVHDSSNPSIVNGELVLVNNANINKTPELVVEFELDANRRWREVGRSWLGGSTGTGTPY